jgi:hypothetical protein
MDSENTISKINLKRVIHIPNKFINTDNLQFSKKKEKEKREIFIFRFSNHFIKSVLRTLRKPEPRSQ